MFQTLRVAVLASKRAPGLEQLLRHPQRNRMFEIACVISTEPAFAQSQAIERADPMKMNRGADAATTAIEMTNVMRLLDQTGREKGLAAVASSRRRGGRAAMRRKP